MATGAGLGGLVTVMLPLIGIVTMLKARRRRKRGLPPPVDKDFERRRAATQEAERRLAAYLAQSGTGGYHAAMDEDEQEIRR